ncbi:hypothetical protein [Rhizobacter sp. LjRoot28]|jgi:hypothetical protein|uniref:hypothetical protein n=1 Tax=Rhizobacter sp. LjRoot28 TaxID=3342309 RepID=UPI003E660F39
MALPDLRPVSQLEGARKPAMPSTIRPLTPPAGRVAPVLQRHSVPSQLSLFPPPGLRAGAR